MLSDISPRLPPAVRQAKTAATRPSTASTTDPGNALERGRAPCGVPVTDTAGSDPIRPSWRGDNGAIAARRTVGLVLRVANGGGVAMTGLTAGGFPEQAVRERARTGAAAAFPPTDGYGR